MFHFMYNQNCWTCKYWAQLLFHLKWDLHPEDIYRKFYMWQNSVSNFKNKLFWRIFLNFRKNTTISTLWLPKVDRNGAVKSSGVKLTKLQQDIIKIIWNTLHSYIPLNKVEVLQQIWVCSHKLITKWIKIFINHT